MFALHETTRKRVCRLAFFALCVAPTVATACWIAGNYWPGRHGRLARALGETLNVHVKLADWRELRPGTTRSSGLVLSDPSSGQLLLRVRTLEIADRGSSRSYTVNEASIEGAQLDILADTIYQWLAKLAPDVHDVSCDKLIVEFATAAGNEAVAVRKNQFVLHNIRGRIDRDAAGRVRAQLAAYGAAEHQDPGSAIRLTLAPSMEGGSVAPTLTLETQSASLPARLLAEAPGFRRFATNVRFKGAVHWTLDQRQPLGSLQGRLDDAQLAELLPPGSPHSLQGAAVIELAEYHWRGDRIERLLGTISARDAAMSRSLLDAAASQYGFRCQQASDGAPVLGNASMVAIDLLALRFQLGSEGLTFWGNCPPEAAMQDGCMAVSGGQPLLIAPPFYNWHLGVLVQTFAAPSAAMLPATREAVDMGGVLPLP